MTPNLLGKDPTGSRSMESVWLRHMPVHMALFGAATITDPKPNREIQNDR